MAATTAAAIAYGVAQQQRQLALRASQRCRQKKYFQPSFGVSDKYRRIHGRRLDRLNWARKNGKISDVGYLFGFYKKLLISECEKVMEPNELSFVRIKAALSEATADNLSFDTLVSSINRFREYVRMRTTQNLISAMTVLPNIENQVYGFDRGEDCHPGWPKSSIR